MRAHCCLLQAAALHLSYAEYDDMGTLERMAILRGLCGLLLSTDAVREVVGARMDAIAALQPKLKVPNLSCLWACMHSASRPSASLHSTRIRDNATLVKMQAASYAVSTSVWVMYRLPTVC